ncbi:MAG: hypothetical protein H3C27_04380 [Opitutaceae bacterium]|nr:hypothetical protein [Opitutaceae bacterium]
MLTLKEKFKIAFLVVGIFVGISGLGLVFSVHRTTSASEDPHYEKGAYANLTGSGALDSYAPWMVLAGAVSMLAAYALREK